MPVQHVKGQAAASTYVQKKGCLTCDTHRETPCTTPQMIMRSYNIRSSSQTGCQSNPVPSKSDWRHTHTHTHTHTHVRACATASSIQNSSFTKLTYGLIDQSNFKLKGMQSELRMSGKRQGGRQTGTADPYARQCT